MSNVSRFLLVLGVLVVVCGFVLAENGVYVHMSHDGNFWNIKKQVLIEWCENPVSGARVDLYSHESQGSEGRCVWTGYTSRMGWCELGEWEEGWYSINASWDGYWSRDGPFYLNSNRTLFNYLDVPSPESWLYERSI